MKPKPANWRGLDIKKAVKPLAQLFLRLEIRGVALRVLVAALVIFEIDPILGVNGRIS